MLRALEDGTRPKYQLNPAIYGLTAVCKEDGLEVVNLVGRAGSLPPDMDVIFDSAHIQLGDVDDKLVEHTRPWEIGWHDAPRGGVGVAEEGESGGQAHTRTGLQSQVQD